MPTVLRQMTFKNSGKLCCLNCLHSFKAEYKCKCHEKVCVCVSSHCAIQKNKYNTSEIIKYIKPHKISNIIYISIELLI